MTGELAMTTLDGKQVKLAGRRRNPDEVETWGR